LAILLKLDANKEQEALQFLRDRNVIVTKLDKDVLRNV
ncbi:MAG: methionine ABC transporter ATP-binding protein, partial [Lactobacillus iners]|nr:methionine ABC transporter ATP-binding protein [Lactobacillus iners]